MKKYIALLITLLLVLSLAGCGETAVLEETFTYEAQTQIRSLSIDIGAADFNIRYGDAVSVESNLKYLSVSEENGVLIIEEEKKSGVKYDDPILILCVPEGTVFENVKISTGAAKLTAESLHAQSLQLQLGAGDVSISSLTVQDGAVIKGGAGKVTVAGGTIHNLEMEMGVGELELTAALLGDSELTFGVGESHITVIGSKEDYSLSVEKGLGSVTVDGEAVTQLEGNGENRLQIKGGVGAVKLEFQEATGA